MLNNILISRETREVISKDEVFIGMEGENQQCTEPKKLDSIN